MTVYVDDMQAAYRGMTMCHMVASTDEELHVMADTIGVARRHHQKPPKVHYSHYDICLSKRALAIKAGAVLITVRQAAMLCRRHRVTGDMGSHLDVEAWFEAYSAQRRQSIANERQ